MKEGEKEKIEKIQYKRGRERENIQDREREKERKGEYKRESERQNIRVREREKMLEYKREEKK